MDYGEYFIIKAVLEVEAPEVISYPVNGGIGIDTNVDHFALTEVEHYGNIVNTKILLFRSVGYSRNQKSNDIYHCAKDIIKYCVESNKPLIIKNLDFDKKKSQMRYSNKKKNRTLSNFVYSKIKEKLERKALLNRIEVIEVNPAYTSKIGKEKYSQLKGMSVHMAASLVIARRGLNYP